MLQFDSSDPAHKFYNLLQRFDMKSLFRLKHNCFEKDLVLKYHNEIV